MSGKMMRNIGLLLALALVVFLVHKHLQTAPIAANQLVGGPFSLETDSAAGDSGGALQFNDQRNIIAGNPDF